MSSPALDKSNLLINKILIYPGMENDGMLGKVTVLLVQVYILSMTILAFFLNITPLLIYGIALLVTGIASLVFFHYSRQKEMDWVIFIGMLTAMIISFYYVNSLGGISASGGLIMAGPVIVFLSVILQRDVWTKFLIILFLVLVATTFIVQYVFVIDPRLSPAENTLFFTCNSILLGGVIFSVVGKLFQYKLKWNKAQSEKSNRELEINRIKVRMYDEVYDAFRTPLHQIINKTELIMADHSSNHGNRPQEVVNDGKFMLHIMKQMSDLAKLDANQLEVNKIQSDFIRFSQHIVKEFQKYGESKGLSMKFLSNFDQFNLDFDPDKILTILSTIFSDAILRSKTNGEIVIRVNREQENSFKDLVEIIIEDQGDVIDEQRLKLLYSPSDMNAGSNGRDFSIYSSVGYVLSGKLVRLMGGKIFARSKQDRGTRFRIHLPVQNAMPFTGYKELINLTEVRPNFIPVPSNKPIGSRMNESDQSVNGEVYPNKSKKTPIA